MLILGSLLLSMSFAMPKPRFQKLQRQLQKLSFSDEKIQLLKKIRTNQTFTANQIIWILQNISFNKDRLKGLQILAPHLSNPAKKQKIVQSFSYPSDRQKAKRILQQYAPAIPKNQKANNKNSFVIGRNEAGPVLKWVGRCQKNNNMYSKNCVALHPNRFDPLQRRRKAKFSHQPLLLAKTKQAITITAKLREPQPKCQPTVSTPSNEEDTTKSWTILPSSKRQIVDLNQLITNWRYRTATLSVTSGALRTTIQLKNWPLCQQ